MNWVEERLITPLPRLL